MKTARLLKATRLLPALALMLAACDRSPPMQTAPPVAQAPASVSSTAPAAEQFAAVQTPTAGASRIYGSYTRGCIAGAEQLPLDGPHWQVLNPSRNRAWGHPSLIRFIRALADEVASAGYGGLLIGDMAQPRGGPLPSDHNSHQVGLDADIWLTPMPARKLAGGALETFDPPPMVDLDKLQIDASLFGPAQAAMLRLAAQAPEVERIFVSPPIKQALCKRTPPGERAWLRKLRPWTGHTEHMHVRLACPAGSADCKPQEPPPEGDGCGAELQSWFKDTAWTKQGPGRYVPETAIKLDQLPAECRNVLTGRG